MHKMSPQYLSSKASKIIAHITITVVTLYAQPVEEALASLASHTLCRERKGLVTLQLLNCCRGMQLSNIVLDNTSVKHVM